MNPTDIEKLIAGRIDCARVHVESDDGRHYRALIVAGAFEGKSRVARHQLVYAALGDHMREAIHALSMQTLTPDELEKLNG
jgi:acid stress-induced BolA-like protein IbaG/YrbA